MAKRDRKEEKSVPLESDADQALDRLAARVEDAVRTIRDLRAERDDLKAKLTAAEERLADGEAESGRVAELEGERQAWEGQRDEIRTRIEKILGKLDLIEEP